jgi:hypothetical protein
MRFRRFQGFLEADENLVTNSDIRQMNIRGFYRMLLFVGLTLFCVNPLGKIECHFVSARPDDRDLLFTDRFDRTFRASVRSGSNGVRCRCVYQAIQSSILCRAFHQTVQGGDEADNRYQ